MRYRAGTCLLKLAKVKAFDRALTEHFETVASLVMDSCEDVRHKFLLKLGECLPSQRLLPRWNLLPALAAIDPEPENVALVSCMGLRMGCSKLTAIGDLYNAHQRPSLSTSHNRGSN